MKGYLNKYNGVLKRSKQKFFELTSERVCYFKEEGLPGYPHKVFPLKECTITLNDGYLTITAGANQVQASHENASYLQKWYQEIGGAIEALLKMTNATSQEMKLKEDNNGSSIRAPTARLSWKR
mgnify:CR=1 FL=1